MKDKLDKLDLYKEAREDYKPINWTRCYICEMSPVFRRAWKNSMEEIMEDAREFLLKNEITSHSVPEKSSYEEETEATSLFRDTAPYIRPNTCEEKEERNKAFHSIRIQFLDYMIEKLSRP